MQNFVTHFTFTQGFQQQYVETDMASLLHLKVVARDIVSFLMAPRLRGAIRHIPDICHGLTDGVRGEKIGHVEKFQISVHDRCGEI